MTTAGGSDGQVSGADELFAELVRTHGQKRAAAVLGVSLQTVRRSLKAGRPTPLLRRMLEAQLLRRGREEPSPAVVGDARTARGGDAIGDADDDRQDGKGIAMAVLKDLNAPELNHAQIESELTDLPLKKLVAFLAITVDQLQRYLASSQSGGSGQGVAAPFAREPGSDAGAAAGKLLAAEGGALTEDHETALPDETSGSGLGASTLGDARAWEAMRAIAAHDDELLKKWWDARILESAAGTELERVTARERTLQAEMAVVWERGKATRLGEAWYATKQEREWESRWRALREISRKRRRLVRMRRLRRLLSLGLWRS